MKKLFAFLLVLFLPIAAIAENSVLDIFLTELEEWRELENKCKDQLIDITATRALAIIDTLELMEKQGVDTYNEDVIWKSLLSDLVAALPELGGVIDTTTGDILVSTQSLKDYIDTWKTKQHDIIYPTVNTATTAESAEETYITLEPGIYTVGTGKDFKPGTYRFMYDLDSDFMTRIRIGDELNISKTDITYDRQKFDLVNPYSGGYYFQLTEAYFRLKDGDYVVVEYGNVRIEKMEKELEW